MITKGGNMSEVSENEAALSGESEEGTPGRRRNAGTDSEPGIVRIKLPPEISQRVREAVAEMKLRGVSVTAEELLAGFVGSLPESYLMDEVLRRTPEEFYIRAAIQIPELREKLARQARKALVKKSSPDGPSEGSRRQKKSKTEALSGNENSAGPEVQA